MFSIYSGAEEFKQWDLDQLVVNDCMKEGDDVVFRACGKTYETTAYVQDGKVVADVPNFLLQKPCNIRVDLGWGLDCHLDCRTYINVAAQDKPDDYVCEYNIKSKGTSAGVSSWNDLADRPFYKVSGTIPLAVNYYSSGEHDFTAVENLALTFEEGDCKIKDCSIDLWSADTFKVVWDGVEYECERGEDPEEGFTALGSSADGHPFCFVSWDGAWGGIRIFSYGANGERETGTTTHTISVYTFGDKVVTIPAEYLPKAEAVGNVWATEYATAEDFNNLLRALIDAGYLAEN